MQVGIGQFAQAVVDRFRHWALRNADAGRLAGFQVGDELVVGVAANALMHVGGKIGCVPILDWPALQWFGDSAVAQNAVAVVAFSAMSKTLDEVGAAIDLG